jgi:HEAT repeat protein
VRRIPFTLEVESLAGQELAQALQPPRPEAPTVLKADELDGLLKDLASDDQGKRMSAASRLMTAEIESPASALFDAVARRTDDEDNIYRMMAVHIFGRYGQAEQVPVMIRLLRNADQGNRRELLDGLRRLKDNRAIEPLADLIARGGFDSQSVAEVLVSFGPAAEDAALQLLKERNLETRRYACDILRQVGGARSLEPLKAQMLEHDQNLNQAATNAARAVQDRTDATGTGH